MGIHMEQRQVQITIDGKTKEYDAPVRYADLAKEYQPMYMHDIVLVMANGKLQELRKAAKKDCTIEFVTTAEQFGKKAYERSMMLLLLKAAYDVAGFSNIEKLRVECSLQQGLYLTLRGAQQVDAEFLQAVDARMRVLVEEDLPIEKRTVDTDEAIRRFDKHHMFDKKRLFHYRRVSKVNLYSIAGFEDYYYGYMVPSTGYLKYFALHLYAEGFVMQLPTVQAPEEVPPFAPYEKLFSVLQRSEKWGEMLGIDTVGALNDRITKENIHELLLVQEALQEKEIAQIAQSIYEQKDKRVVLIAGPSSSGKTTFSHRLSIQLKTFGLKPHPIPVDDYFVNRDQTPLDKYGQHDFECLEAIDVRQFNQDMLSLLAGERVQLPTYNFLTGKREYKDNNYLQIGEDDILVIEGIHCLNEELTRYLPRENKFKIYISALTALNIDEHNRIPTTDARMIRRMVRDARTRGISAKDTIARWPSVRRGEEKNIFPYQEEADVMFNSSLIYELAVLKQYAEPALFAISKDAPEYQEAKRMLKFLDYFVGISGENVPANSILREFIGGGCFQI